MSKPSEFDLYLAETLQNPEFKAEWDDLQANTNAAGTPAKGPAGTDFSSFLAEQLQDPEVKAEWDALEPEFAHKQKQMLADVEAFLAEYADDFRKMAEWDALEPEFAAKQAAIDARIAAEGSNTPFPTDALRGILVNDCDDKQAREERLAKYTRPTIEELFEGYDGSYTPTEIDWGEPIGKEEF